MFSSWLDSKLKNSHPFLVTSDPPHLAWKGRRKQNSIFKSIAFLWLFKTFDCTILFLLLYNITFGHFNQMSIFYKVSWFFKIHDQNLKKSIIDDWFLREKYQTWRYKSWRFSRNVRSKVAFVSTKTRTAQSISYTFFLASLGWSMNVLLKTGFEVNSFCSSVLKKKV